VAELCRLDIHIRQSSDRQRCEEAPLSLYAFRDFKKDDHGISRSGNSFAGPLPNILLSYDLLARLLLGSRHSTGFMESSCLVSAYGWSLFFDIFDAADPADITTGLLHLAMGVPTRTDCRKDRIIDGPTNFRGTSTKGVVLNSKCPRIEFWPGVWSGRVGILVPTLEITGAILSMLCSILNGHKNILNGREVKANPSPGNSDFARRWSFVEDLAEAGPWPLSVQ
jgi:hypothetical protein